MNNITQVKVKQEPLNKICSGVIAMASFARGVETFTHETVHLTFNRARYIIPAKPLVDGSGWSSG